MNIKAFFAPEVCIRLTDDLSGLVCTTQRGRFLKRCEEFAVQSRPAQAVEPMDGHAVSELTRARSRWPPRNR